MGQFTLTFYGHSSKMWNQIETTSFCDLFLLCKAKTHMKNHKFFLSSTCFVRCSFLSFQGQIWKRNLLGLCHSNIVQQKDKDYGGCMDGVSITL
jgi:hypothetical protein